MKMTSTTRDLLALAMALGLTACGGLAAADNPEAESLGAGPSGSIEAVCTNRGSQCDWEITKCKAEPGCARWYACVSACDAANPTSCFSGCQSKGEPDNGATILACLQKACAQGGAESSLGGMGGGAYNGGAAGAGPTDKGDGGADDLGDVTAPTAAASWETCMSCLYSGSYASSNGGTVQNCMAQCNSGCEQDYAKCTSGCANADETCLAECNKTGQTCKGGCETAGTYKHVIGNNAPNEVTGDVPGCLLQTTFEGWEKCMYDSATWVSTATWEQFVSSGLNECVMTQCAAACIPKGTYEDCSTCLQGKCSEQSHEYWSSAAAQDYGWCMDYCDPTVHESCDCEGLYGEGAEILTQFVMCREQYCYDQCK